MMEFSEYDPALWLHRVMSELDNDSTIHQRQLTPEIPKEQLDQIVHNKPVSPLIAIQDHQDLGLGLLTAPDHRPAFALRNLPKESSDDTCLMAAIPGSEPIPTYDREAIGMTPDVVQRGEPQNVLLSNADQAQYPVLMPEFYSVESKAPLQMQAPINVPGTPISPWPPADIVSNPIPEPAIIQWTPPNPLPLVSIMPNSNSAPFTPNNVSLTTRCDPISGPSSSTFNSVDVPSVQRPLQPRPTETIAPRYSAPNSSLRPGVLGMNSLPASTGEQIISFGPPKAFPSTGKAKRKRNLAGAVARKRQPTTTRESRTKIYAPGCHNYKLPANPGKDHVPQKKNMHPCIRCRLDQKGCTGGFPCERCQENVRGAVARRSSQVLWRQLCIQNEIWEFSFFSRIVRVITGCPAGGQSAARYALNNSMFDLSLHDRKTPELLHSAFAGIVLMRMVGVYIVAHSPTIQRLQWGVSPKTLKTVRKISRFGSRWKVPRPPPFGMLSGIHLEQDLDLVWVAICLHADSIFEYLDLSPETYLLALICLDTRFFIYLDILLVQRNSLMHSVLATTFFCNFLNIAERNYGTLYPEHKRETGNQNWRLDLSRHAVGWAQFHLDRLKKYLATILSKEEKKSYQSISDNYAAACAEIAEMDLSKWGEVSPRREKLVERFMHVDDEKNEDEGAYDDDLEGELAHEERGVSISLFSPTHTSLRITARVDFTSQK